MKRILVIGAGLIGSRHIKTVQAHVGCSLAGVVDPDPAYQPEPGVVRFTDLADVDVPVDGAIIATPTGLHRSHGEAAARRGWHLLIEKPVAGTVEDALALDAVVKRCGVHCLVGHHRRYHDSIQKLRDVIASGKIGEPVTSTMIWAVRKPDEYFNTDWRRTGGSPVMINLIHDVDLLRFVLGEIADATGFSSQTQRAAGRVESGAVALRFASGVCGTISFTDTAPSPWGFEAATAENPNIAATGQDMWWITGTEGGVSFPSLTLWTGADSWAEAPVSEVVHASRTTPLMAQLDHFVDVIGGKAAPLNPISDAGESLRVTQELEELLSMQGAKTT
ncbi:MAG: Gfo/Idh/MocA family protein [Pikeienuella sp.]